MPKGAQQLASIHHSLPPRFSRRLPKPRSQERVKALKGERSWRGSGRRLAFPERPQPDLQGPEPCPPRPGQPATGWRPPFAAEVPSFYLGPPPPPSTTLFLCRSASDWPSPRALPAPPLPPLVKTAGAGYGAATGGGGASAGGCSGGGPEARWELEPGRDPGRRDG